jgi:hypothetical protein
MGSILASAIIDDAEDILQDTANRTWTAAAHLEALNDGQREIVTLRSDAYVVNESVALAPGAKQALPARGLLLINITRNMGTDGRDPGDAITLVDRGDMDEALPGWYLSVYANRTVIHFMYNKKDPKVFYVYPPQPDTEQNYVEMEYSKTPEDIVTTAAITLDDVYKSALMLFILYRAWLKKKPELAQGYYSAFLQNLGLGEKQAQADDPNAVKMVPQAGG